MRFTTRPFGCSLRRAVAADFFSNGWCFQSKVSRVIADAPWLLLSHGICQRDSDGLMPQTVHSCRAFRTELPSPLPGYLLKATFGNARHGSEIENNPHSSRNTVGLVVSKLWLGKLFRSYRSNWVVTKSCRISFSIYDDETLSSGSHETVKKLCGLSPRENYTDWATAACRRS
jgi:hypothetical protein